MVMLYNQLPVPVINVLTGISPCDPVLQALNGLLAVHKSLHRHAGNLCSALTAVHLPDTQLLGHIHHSPGKITRVRRPQSRVGKSLPGAVSGHEILQNVQSLTEIGLNGQLYGSSRGVGHQSAHTRQLLNLLVGTTGTGVRHHVDIIVFIQARQKHLRQLFVRLIPGLNHRPVPLFLRDQSPSEVGGDLIHRSLGLSQHLRLLGRHGHIGNGHGHGRPGGVLISYGLYIVQHLRRSGSSMGVDNLLQDLLQSLLVHMEVHLGQKEILRQVSVYKAQVLGQDLIEDKPSQRGLHISRHHFSLGVLLGSAHLDPGVKGTGFILISQNGFVHIFKVPALSQRSGPLLGQVIDAQNHVLGRHRHRAAVGRLQQVVGGQQQETALRLRLHRKGKMHCHLIPVKVRVESRTHQRMELDGLALYQNGLKSLDAQPVKCGGAVEHHRVLFDNLLQHIPHLVIHLVNQLLCILDILADALRHQILHHERLKQLNGHLLGQTALVNLQLRPHHDNGTTGIIHTLAQKVLAETAGFSLQHVGEGFQRPVSGPCHRTSPSAVVNQRVHRLLKHSLLVADDNVRSPQFQKSLQTIIPVDDPPVKVIQIRGGKAAAVQLNHRTDVGGNHRDRVHDHPLRQVARLPEGLNHFQSLDDAGTLLAGGISQAGPQLIRLLVQVNGSEQLLNGLRPHAHAELAAIGIPCVLVLLLGEYLLIIKAGLPLIQHNIGCKIQHFFQNPGRQVQDQPHTAWNALKVPDMGHRGSQFNMPHALPPDAGLGDFHAAPVADHSLVSDFLIFTAVALPVLAGPENLLAEQTVPLGLQRPVVNSLRLHYLAMGPLTDFIG